MPTATSPVKFRQGPLRGPAMPTGIGTSPVEARRCPLRSRAGKEEDEEEEKEGKEEEEQQPLIKSNPHLAGGNQLLQAAVAPAV